MILLLLKIVLDQILFTKENRKMSIKKRNCQVKKINLNYQNIDIYRINVFFNEKIKKQKMSTSKKIKKVSLKTFTKEYKCSMIYLA